MSEDLDILVERYLDGSLDAPGAERITGALHVGGASALAIRERIALAGLLGLALDPVDDRAVARGVSERLRAVDGSMEFGQELRRRLARQPARPRVLHPRRRRPAIHGPGRLLGMAAATLTAVVAVWWLVSSSAPSATPAWALRTGSVPAVSLNDGEHLVLPDGGVLTASDGTQLTCEPGTTVDVFLRDDGPRFAMDAGGIEAAVAPQAPGRPMSITTAEARITVVGTRFRIARNIEGTRLAMHEGTVRLDRRQENREELVHAGETALIAATGRIPPAAAEPPWRPLFSDSDLAGWNRTTGRWSNDRGVVRGEAVDGAKARIETGTAFTDLELTCRLRITGARPSAEIQVGDYNWFAKVPAGAAGAWTEVVLRQHGASLTATADGRPLEIEAGDGQAPRPGRLAFYVGIGGIVEIADGRLRSWAVPP